MKQRQAIGGREALARAIIVIVGIALLLVLFSFVVTLGGAGMPFLVVVLTLLGIVGGIFLAIRWALTPWLLGRVERKLWDGSLKLDQAKVLRRRGLS